MFRVTLRASLETPFSEGILIFPKKNELISLEKNGNPLAKWSS
jgi:hypothetical protein